MSAWINPGVIDSMEKSAYYSAHRGGSNVAPILKNGVDLMAKFNALFQLGRGQKHGTELFVLPAFLLATVL